MPAKFLVLRDIDNLIGSTNHSLLHMILLIHLIWKSTRRARSMPIKNHLQVVQKRHYMYDGQASGPSLMHGSTYQVRVLEKYRNHLHKNDSLLLWLCVSQTSFSFAIQSPGQTEHAGLCFCVRCCWRTWRCAICCSPAAFQAGICCIGQRTFRLTHGFNPTRRV